MKARKIEILLMFRLVLISLILVGFLMMAAAAPAVAQQEKSGAKLWAENCGRCHNFRSPQERSDRQWEIIMQHMRTRAYLTGQETRKILEFLKQAN